MAWILVVAVTWLFLLVLAVAILRTAAQADRDAERRRRESRPPPRRAGTRRRQAAKTTLVVVALPFAGGSAGAPDADAANCNTARAAARMAAPSATLCLVNRQRRAHRIAPLIGNARLGLAANRHAADMIRRGYFAHLSPEGTSFVDRLRSAGYIRGCAWAAGETLAWGSGTESSPWSRVAAWMHSPPHRAILLSATYREVGIGVMKGSPGMGPSGFTYVGEFGRRRC
jgi:uncharacterized protein YkwD